MEQIGMYEHEIKCKICKAVIGNIDHDIGLMELNIICNDCKRIMTNMEND